jgi:predicted SprT family Zn-dependent metalloprotease
MKNLLLEKLNTKISDDLGVEKLKIKYEVSTRAKSKFGHCKYIEPKHYLINLSSFILDTELEKDTIAHELCHAYDHHYFKLGTETAGCDPKPHGDAWKMLMDKVFGYKDIKAQGIHKSNSKYNKFIGKGNGGYDLYVKGYKKAVFSIDEGLCSIKTPSNQHFESKIVEEKYMQLFGEFLFE